MALTNTFGNYQNEFGRAYEDGRQGFRYMNKEIPKVLNDVNLRKSDFIKAVSDMKERNSINDNNIRMMMLGTSVAQGILAGYTINSRYLEAQPLPFITPMVMSFGYAGIVDEAKGDRRMLISATLGAPLCANLLLGAFYGKLTMSYTFLSLGYIAIGGIIMQLLFYKAHDRDTGKKKQSYQCKSGWEYKYRQLGSDESLLNLSDTTAMDGVYKEEAGCLHELEETMQSLHQPAKFFGLAAPPLTEDTRNQVESQAQELTTSSVSPATKPLIEVLVWTTLLIFFANVGIVVGSYILGPLLSTFLGKYGAVILAFVVIPSYTYYSITKIVALITVAIGAAVIFNLTVGIVTANLSFIYFPLTLICAGIAALVVQLILKKLQGEVSIRAHGVS
ncbi:unnamed protein product [Angiostrongylus costaricensis]|uniref:MFS domain-containing protein n=1 Tax=Angiostrongylus costaricensis TaxID=334426 RepID=A0A158PM51_ANGCS|nr:unnamed protein product [Angiostrongylus costaricensis]